MSPKHFSQLENDARQVIASVYASMMSSLDGIKENFVHFLSGPDKVYDMAKSTPHAAVDYLHSISNSPLRRRMIELYRNMLITLIDDLRNLEYKNIALVFKRALEILQDDFREELLAPIEDTACNFTQLENAKAESPSPDGIVSIAEGQCEIEEYAYSNRDEISRLVIPSTVTKIHNRAFTNFYGSYIVKILNPKYSSADGILYNKDKSVLIRVPVKVGFDAYSTAPAVNTIGRYSFQGAIHLVSVDFGDNVERIEDFAFDENIDLEELHISRNLIYIGHRILFGCNNLRLIYCNIVDLSKITIELDAFDGIDLADITLIVPLSVLDKYLQHPLFGNFGNIIANNNILENKPLTEVSSNATSVNRCCGGSGGWTTYHGYQSVSGHYRSGYWRNGHWVSGCYVHSHGRWR